MALNLGRMMPGETCILNLGIIEECEVSDNAFEFSLPASFFPDYLKHEVDDWR